METNTEYWERRTLDIINDNDRISDAHISKIKKIYDRACSNITTEVEKIYNNYAKETGIDVQTLKQLQTKYRTSKVYKELKAQGYDQYVMDNYKSRITRLDQIKAQLYQQTKTVYADEELLHHSCYSQIVNNSYYRTIYNTTRGLGYNMSFATIDKNLINAIIEHNWSGKNYSQRIWGNTNILGDSISEIVGGALLSGQDIYKTTKQIRDRFGVAKHYAERLVRTESNYFQNEAEARAYEDMGFKEYVYMATLDNRTSEVCQNLDNKRFKVNDRKVGVNYPPMHPYCRSTTRVYIDDEIEKSLKRRAKDTNTGISKIVDNVSYKDWYNGLDTYIDNTNIDKAIVPIPQGGSIILNSLKNLKGINSIYYNPVTELERELTTEEIVEKISGKDLTDGSCQSLALTYIANKCNIDAVDFRGGNSCDFFSKDNNLKYLLNSLRVKYQFIRNTDDFQAANILMKSMNDQDEYMIAVGKHTSIVRKNNNNYQYLELQTKDNNIYKTLNDSVLKDRFKCLKEHFFYGINVDRNSFLVNINEFKQCDKNHFAEIMGYINTKKDRQQKRRIKL